MITGGCHCGAVRFEIAGEIRGFQHWVSQQAPSYEIHDDLPRLDEM